MEKTISNAIQKFFKIQTKDGSLINITFNEAQKKFYEEFKKDYGTKPPRYIVLKARQLGISTFTEALITALTISNANSHSVIVAHESDAATNIYRMAKRYITNLPDAIRPNQKYSNAKELVFDRDDGKGLGSSISVLTVGEGARGSTYRYVHLSELAFWNNAEKAMLAIMQTVSDDPKSLVVIESTANGMNYFYNLWQDASSGKNDFTPLFFPWYIDPSYVRKYDGFKLTEKEKELQKIYRLSDEQIAWRRYTIANKCNGDETLFRQEYPICPEEAFIVSGNPVFNIEKVLARMKVVKAPIKCGYFKYDYDGLKVTNIRWIDDEKGIIAIYQDVEQSLQYCIGDDTAGEGSDFFVGQVVSTEGNQCAVLRHQTDSDLHTKQLYCLGKYYNNALLTIEVNFDSYPIQEMQRLGYLHMYVREVNDTALDKYRKSYGFRTDSWTRPAIINHLVELVRDHVEFINDMPTLNEMLVFIRNDKGKMVGQDGCHDDCVMSLAIAYEGLSQVKVKKPKAKPDFSDDETSHKFEDFWG